MLKFLKWLDDHILEYLSFALLIFIPLYPKIPSFDILPGYIVRVRLDDFLVAFAFGIWLIWLYRKKVTLKNNPLFIPMAIYIVAGLLSVLSAMFITKTVPLTIPQVGKTFLNWGRRIEYFSVFFVFFSSIKSFSQVKKYVYISALVLLAVSIYGFGQKYLYWPAYSTMNREFSKGIKLYLTPHARVLSTFGGHYDLAAYLLISLTFFISVAFMVKNIFSKFFFLIISLCGFWLLILTVSRASFLGFLVGITFSFWLLAAKRGWLWVISRWFVVVLFSLFIMLSFGDLSSRFAHILSLDKFKDLILSPIKSAPQGTNVAYLDMVANKSDIPPTSQKPSAQPTQPPRPSDVYQNIPLYGSASGLPATLAAKPRTYSQAALEYDLSAGIRLDYSWPHAIQGFLKNPVFGSGYATLTKQSVEEFSQAESTDNDFLRALGETGLLGFLTFFGIITIICLYAYRNLKKITDPFAQAIVASTFAAIVGLMINAIFIDIFEASKVAYAFWMLTAIFFATIKFSTAKQEK